MSSAFHTYVVHGPSRSGLEELARELVEVFDFDGSTLDVQRSPAARKQALGRALRRALGVRDQDDWQMVLAGPNNRAAQGQAANLADKFDAYVVRTSQDFAYDPAQWYSEQQVDLYTRMRAIDVAQYEEELRWLMTPQQRKQYDDATRNVLRARARGEGWVD